MVFVESRAGQVDVVRGGSRRLHARLGRSGAQRALVVHVAPHGEGIAPVGKRCGEDDRLRGIVVPDADVALLGNGASRLVVDDIVERMDIPAEREVVGHTLHHPQFHGIVDVEVVPVLDRQRDLQRRALGQGLADAAARKGEEQGAEEQPGSPAAAAGKRAAYGSGAEGARSRHVRPCVTSRAQGSSYGLHGCSRFRTDTRR